MNKSNDYRERLIEARKRLGLSVEEMAEKHGVAINTVYRLKRSMGKDV